jgi:hypothetical protein
VVENGNSIAALGLGHSDSDLGVEKPQTNRFGPYLKRHVSDLFASSSKVF